MEEKSSETGPTGHIESLDKYQADMPNACRSRTRKFLIILSLILPFYIVFSLLSNARPGLPPPAGQSPTLPLTLDPNRSLVPLEAHIMSKCPDARDCLRDLVVPAMEQVVDKANFTLSFIGSCVTPFSVSRPGSLALRVHS